MRNCCNANKFNVFQNRKPTQRTQEKNETYYWEYNEKNILKYNNLRKKL